MFYEEDLCPSLSLDLRDTMWGNHTTKCDFVWRGLVPSFLLYCPSISLVVTGTMWGHDPTKSITLFLAWGIVPSCFLLWGHAPTIFIYFIVMKRTCALHGFVDPTNKVKRTCSLHMVWIMKFLACHYQSLEDLFPSYVFDVWGTMWGHAPTKIIFYSIWRGMIPSFLLPWGHDPTNVYALFYMKRTCALHFFDEDMCPSDYTCYPCSGVYIYHWLFVSVRTCSHKCFINMF